MSKRQSKLECMSSSTVKVITKGRCIWIVTEVVNSNCFLPHAGECPPCMAFPECQPTSPECALTCSDFPMDQFDNEVVINCSRCQQRDFEQCVYLHCLFFEDEAPPESCTELLENTCGNRTTLQQQDELAEGCYRFCDNTSLKECGSPQIEMCMNTSVIFCRNPDRSEECSINCAIHENCVSHILV